ncbi:hypothetical protein [Kutzneria sp. NPDC052558]|uniref:hypothetical protein n=1 Tax=Kutzneria sp. NPDC052558 TaxID=3364121 RepID=UPI0037C7274C
MNMVRHPRPPAIDTLRCTPRRGLDAIASADHRALVADVLSSGLVDTLIELTDPFDPSANLAQARADADTLDREFKAFGVRIPAATIRNITMMRAIMVPIEDDALALAVDRIWVFTTNTDDVCCHDRAEAEAILRAGMTPETTPSTPNTRYIRHMFAEIARHCDPSFLAVFKSFFYNAITGVLMEAEFTPEVSDDVDSDFVRVFNGFSQFWFTSVQFCDPCLSARRHGAFWAAALSSGVAFLNDVNDVLSFYKEAVHGADFAASRIYRRSIQENLPYLAVYRQSLDGGLAAYRRILELATDEQRPHLDRYLTGFAYWHFHCRRYRWQDIYPDLTPIELTAT